MNHCVPDLEMDDHYSNILTSSSGLTHSRKLSSVNNRQEDDIMELLWHNGQVVMQSQNQRSCLKKSPPPIFKYDAVIPTDTEPRSSQLPKEHESASHSQCHNQQHLFIEEDEMAAWLHYPLVDDQSFTADLLYPPPATTTTTSTPPVPTTHNTDIRPPETSTVQISRPPLHPIRREVDTRLPNFGGYFSRLKTGLVESGPSSVVKESTNVVDSSETPAKRRMTEDASNENFMRGVGLVEMTSSGGGGGRGKEVTKCEKTVTSSSPGGSSATAEPTPTEKPFVEERKRKGIEEEDETECQSEDGDFQYGDAMKQERATSSTKRTRAAEVHNLSERRRRDRINEKLKALQELIPRCNKSDKASMLDEAIEYLKSLQLQIQMMSMGCTMVPMMFPGVQQYMPPMGMGMGMGMGMEMGMNQPLMSFPNVLAGPALPTSAAANHLWPRFPMPAFHIPPAPATVPSRMQARIQSDYMPNSVCTPYPNQSRIPNFPDPYQQYIGSHQQAHWPLHQYQTMVQPNSTKPSTSRGAENHENSRSG